MEKARGKGLEESVTGRAGPLQRAIYNLHPLSFHAYCTCTGMYVLSYKQGACSPWL